MDRPNERGVSERLDTLRAGHAHIALKASPQDHRRQRQPNLKGTAMAKYGPTASKKVEQTMRERKRGTLRSGSGKKVTSRKQAIAIGLSEARRAGAKVPRRKS
jgi:hypothetical protein